jgi:hypothetical protein
VAVAAVLDPVDLVNHASQLAHHLPLAYEPVALPCSLMNCGDVVHRRYALVCYALLPCIASAVFTLQSVFLTAPSTLFFARKWVGLIGGLSP